MAQPLSPDDLPDPLEPPRGDPLGGTEEDLLSQLVGDDIDRMLSADDLPLTGRGAVQELTSQLGTFFQELHKREQTKPPAPAAPKKRPASAASSSASRRPPELARPQPEPSAAVPLEEQLEISHDEMQALRPDDVFGDDSTGDDIAGEIGHDVEPADGPRPAHAVLAAVVPEEPEPLYLKPLNWISDPIASLSGGARALVNVTAVLSFVGACAAMAYVLVLTHAQN
jgi:hypothetical protein